MFPLPIVATTRHLSMQEGAGLKMEIRLQTLAATQTKFKAEKKMERRQKKAPLRLGHEIHRGVEQGQRKSLGALLADLRGT